MKEVEMEQITLKLAGQEERIVTQPKNPVIEVAGQNKIYGSYFDGTTTKYFDTEAEYNDNVPVLPPVEAEPVDKWGHTQAYYDELKAKLAATQEASEINIQPK